ncbi:MAG: murein hydrolase activator EnvC family protein [Acidimicrobiia bacterium]
MNRRLALDVTSLVVISIGAMTHADAHRAGARASAPDIRALAPGSRPLAPGAWLRPVPGAIVRVFIAPSHPYGPGHRGVDFAVAPNEPVRAAGPGVVTFAGAVAGTLHVVVAHPNGIRTGYSYLAEISVTPGERVSAGAVLGRAGPGVGTAEHGVDTVHFSLRVGEEYRDPMELFRPVDLGAIVHLAPLEP